MSILMLVLSVVKDAAVVVLVSSVLYKLKQGTENYLYLTILLGVLIAF